MKTSDDRLAAKDVGSDSKNTSSDSGCEEVIENPAIGAIRKRQEDLNADSTSDVEGGDPDQMEERELSPGTAQNLEDTTSYQKRWAELYGRLLAFKEKHGHCRVPNRYEEDPQLGYWVSTQRRQRRLLETATDTDVVPLSAERAKKLEDIGFEWSAIPSSHKSWDGRYGELCKFVEKNGHAQVPMGYEENPRLATWVSTQRQEYKLLKQGRSSRLTDEKKKKLDDVGFVWEAQRGRRKIRQDGSISSPVAGKPVEGSPVPQNSRLKAAPRTSLKESPAVQSRSKPRAKGNFTKDAQAKAILGPNLSHESASGENVAVAPMQATRDDSKQSPLDLVVVGAHDRIIQTYGHRHEASGSSTANKIAMLPAHQIDKILPENVVLRPATARAANDPPGLTLAEFPLVSAAASVGADSSSSVECDQGLLTASLPREGLHRQYAGDHISLEAALSRSRQQQSEENALLAALIKPSVPNLGGAQFFNVFGGSASPFGVEQGRISEAILHQLSQQRQLQQLGAFRNMQSRNDVLGVSQLFNGSPAAMLLQSAPTAAAAIPSRDALSELLSQYPDLKKSFEELEKAQRNVARQLNALGNLSELASPGTNRANTAHSDRKRAANPSSKDPKSKKRS